MNPPDSIHAAQIEYAEHAQDILQAAIHELTAGRTCALVASLLIEGGSARSVGSLAVVASDGRMTGYLSNGCIDRDIAVQAAEALTSKIVRGVTYGKGSPFLDLSLPCGGTLGLVIDPSPDVATLQKALADLDARRETQLTFSEKGGLVPLGHPVPQNAVTIVYAPKPKLVLAGRGAVFRATAKLAHDSGLIICLASPDTEDLAAILSFAPAIVVEMATPQTPVKLPIDRHTAVLTLFHDHDWEGVILKAATQGYPFFIGAMGSRKTHQLRRFALQDLGVSDPSIDLIHGPIGLVPSLRNASLIAVSAISQIVQELPPLQVAVDAGKESAVA